MELPAGVCREAEPAPSAEPSTQLPAIITQKLSSGAYEVLTPIDSAGAGEVELENHISFVATRLSELETKTLRPVSSEVVTVFVHWWGYEIALPPPALAKLERARSIQQTVSWFLQGFIAAGGEGKLRSLHKRVTGCRK